MATEPEVGGKWIFTPTKRESGKVSVMLKRGTQCFEVILTLELEVLAILKGGAKSLHPKASLILTRVRGGGG